jgi:hypothetical protein
MLPDDVVKLSIKGHLCHKKSRKAVDVKVVKTLDCNGTFPLDLKS